MGSQQPARAPIAQHHGPLQVEMLAKHSLCCLCFLVNALSFFLFSSVDFKSNLSHCTDMSPGAAELMETQRAWDYTLL